MTATRSGTTTSGARRTSGSKEVPGDGSTSAALPIGNQRDAHHAPVAPRAAPTTAADTGPTEMANRVCAGVSPKARSTSRLANDVEQYRETATPSSTRAASSATSESNSKALASKAVTSRVWRASSYRLTNSALSMPVHAGELAFEFVESGFAIAKSDECVHRNRIGRPDDIVGILQVQAGGGEHVAERRVGLVVEPRRTDDADDGCVDLWTRWPAVVVGIELVGAVQMQRDGVADSLVEGIDETRRHDDLIGTSRIREPTVEEHRSFECGPHLVVDEREEPEGSKIDGRVVGDPLHRESRDGERSDGLDLRHRSHHVPVVGAEVEEHHRCRWVAHRNQSVHRRRAAPRAGGRGGHRCCCERDQQQQADQCSPPGPPFDPEPHPDGSHLGVLSSSRRRRRGRPSSARCVRQRRRPAGRG